MKVFLLIALPMFAAAQDGPSAELETCVQGKIAGAQESCPTEDGCEVACIAAIQDIIPTLDGSCCELATNISPEDCKGLIGQLVQAASSHVDSCKAQIAADATLSCLHDKLEDGFAACPTGPESCEPGCQASLKDILPTLDGSCCNGVEECESEVTEMTTQLKGIVDDCDAQLADNDKENCLAAKLQGAFESCPDGPQSCADECQAAKKDVLGKVDGSCCDGDSECEADIAGFVDMVKGTVDQCEAPALYSTGSKGHLLAAVASLVAFQAAAFVAYKAWWTQPSAKSIPLLIE